MCSFTRICNEKKKKDTTEPTKRWTFRVYLYIQAGRQIWDVNYEENNTLVLHV